jgi:hypothetical protein
MATNRPRITVTVTDEILEVLKHYSNVSGDTVSNIVFQILDNSKDAFRVGADIVLAAKNLESDAKKAMVDSLIPEIIHIDKFSSDSLDRLRRTPLAPPSVCAGGGAGECVADGVNPLAINKGVRSATMHKNSAKPSLNAKKKAKTVWLASTQGGEV